ncbi:MAG TPA: type II toxin-antitoxin system RelE/ParE family toxin [Candidatus Limnocylindria bacterium]|jgi:mRNA interferase RelE/StbE|nr:type II toxin-antitoxin system RelE/ParE family toxin [Candidatus Limnocylindria bacterium]
MTYVLRYHLKVVEDDLRDMPSNIRERLGRSLKTRLTSAPERYGALLRGSLRGYWKLRVGDYRVVFRIVANEVWILAVLHRSKVYETAARRAVARRPGA